MAVSVSYIDNFIKSSFPVNLVIAADHEAELVCFNYSTDIKKIINPDGTKPYHCTDGVTMVARSGSKTSNVQQNLPLNDVYFNFQTYDDAIKPIKPELSLDIGETKFDLSDAIHLTTMPAKNGVMELINSAVAEPAANWLETFLNEVTAYTKALSLVNICGETSNLELFSRYLGYVLVISSNTNDPLEKIRELEHKLLLDHRLKWLDRPDLSSTGRSAISGAPRRSQLFKLIVILHDSTRVANGVEKQVSEALLRVENEPRTVQVVKLGLDGKPAIPRVPTAMPRKLHSAASSYDMLQATSTRLTAISTVSGGFTPPTSISPVPEGGDRGVTYTLSNSTSNPSLVSTAVSTPVPTSTSESLPNGGGGAAKRVLNSYDLEEVRVMSKALLDTLVRWVEWEFLKADENPATKGGANQSSWSRFTTRFTGGSSSKSSGQNVAASSTAFMHNDVKIYRYDAPEIQIRRMADLAFMFRLYPVAYGWYHKLKSEFDTTASPLYLASAYQMAAVSLFMEAIQPQEQPQLASERDASDTLTLSPSFDERRFVKYIFGEIGGKEKQYGAIPLFEKYADTQLFRQSSSSMAADPGFTQNIDRPYLISGTASVLNEAPATGVTPVTFTVRPGEVMFVRAALFYILIARSKMTLSSDVATRLEPKLYWLRSSLCRAVLAEQLGLLFAANGMYRRYTRLLFMAIAGYLEQRKDDVNEYKGNVHAIRCFCNILPYLSMCGMRRACAYFGQQQGRTIYRVFNKLPVMTRTFGVYGFKHHSRPASAMLTEGMLANVASVKDGATKFTSREYAIGNGKEVDAQAELFMVANFRQASLAEESQKGLNGMEACCPSSQHNQPASVNVLHTDRRRLRFIIDGRLRELSTNCMEATGPSEAPFCVRLCERVGEIFPRNERNRDVHRVRDQLNSAAMDAAAVPLASRLMFAQPCVFPLNDRAAMAAGGGTTPYCSAGALLAVEMPILNSHTLPIDLRKLRLHCHLTLEDGTSYCTEQARETYEQTQSAQDRAQSPTDPLAKSTGAGTNESTTMSARMCGSYACMVSVDDHLAFPPLATTSVALLVRPMVSARLRVMGVCYEPQIVAKGGKLLFCRAVMDFEREEECDYRTASERRGNYVRADGARQRHFIPEDALPFEVQVAPPFPDPTVVFDRVPTGRLFCGQVFETSLRIGEMPDVPGLELKAVALVHDAPDEVVVSLKDGSCARGFVNPSKSFGKNAYEVGRARRRTSTLSNENGDDCSSVKLPIELFSSGVDVVVPLHVLAPIEEDAFRVRRVIRFVVLFSFLAKGTENDKNPKYSYRTVFMDFAYSVVNPIDTSTLIRGSSFISEEERKRQPASFSPERHLLSVKVENRLPNDQFDVDLVCFPMLVSRRAAFVQPDETSEGFITRPTVCDSQAIAPCNIAVLNKEENGRAVLSIHGGTNAEHDRLIKALRQVLCLLQVIEPRLAGLTDADTKHVGFARTVDEEDDWSSDEDSANGDSSRAQVLFDDSSRLILAYTIDGEIGFLPAPELLSPTLSPFSLEVRPSTSQITHNFVEGPFLRLGVQVVLRKSIRRINDKFDDCECRLVLQGNDISGNNCACFGSWPKRLRPDEMVKADVIVSGPCLCDVSRCLKVDVISKRSGPALATVRAARAHVCVVQSQT